nr:uncharacterized protein I303_03188 [Kwoniella dejecticola CBS 10117]OBR87164.1 hypothetical protein I303_03188 [Kwoniella dejecticola CBS 10117]
MGYTARCNWCYRIWCPEHTEQDCHRCAQALRTEPYADSVVELRKIQEVVEAEELTKLLDKVKSREDVFVEQAQHLRPRHTCTLDVPPDYANLKASKWFAYCNVHFLIRFDDGVKWLLRVRQTRSHRLPSALTAPIIQSEVATLTVLKNGGVPVPAGFMPPHLVPGSSLEDATDLDYFFLEFMEGTPLSLPFSGYFSEIQLPDDQLADFIEEYAKTRIQLSNLRLPYTKLGCIFPSEDAISDIGPIVGLSCFMNPSQPHFMGPFSTFKDMMLAKIDAALRYSKINALQGSYTVDEYLWHLEMRELVAASKELGEAPTELYIKHDDSKGDELSVDSDGKIIGILDWEWAYVITKNDAFYTPHFFNRTFAYMKGSNALSHAEKMLIECYKRHSREDLAECVRKGKLYLRLERIGMYEPAFTKKGFREVFGDDMPKDINPPEDDDGWREYMIDRYKDDEDVKEVIARYGSN